MKDKFNKALLLIIATGIWVIVYQNYQSTNKIQKVNVENKTQDVRVLRVPAPFSDPPEPETPRYY